MIICTKSETYLDNFCGISFPKNFFCSIALIRVRAKPARGPFAGQRPRGVINYRIETSFNEGRSMSDNYSGCHLQRR